MSGSVVQAADTVYMEPGFSCGFVFFAVNMALLLGAGINLVEPWTL
ncbi:hypothetical protein [Paraburkholderia haematera]|jgi:hypothetical protein|uniref:Uncharacterized protein n=1 Tax=Paraburkholderia haematera TaxID=2793077 RepID=A0ABM8QIU8_9BURK|nr:hypothetical protein [Paraburkholderia haematera]CAE6699096.1 hypothetical protein R69888_00637 [Paraburkholderia haematera]